MILFVRHASNELDLTELYQTFNPDSFATTDTTDTTVINDITDTSALSATTATTATILESP
jgi:hypothetical protein